MCAYRHRQMFECLSFQQVMSQLSLCVVIICENALAGNYGVNITLFRFEIKHPVPSVFIFTSQLHSRSTAYILCKHF